MQETVAITQNYVSACNLLRVLRHLQNPTLVSGCSSEERATLHDRFMEALQGHRPQVRQLWLWSDCQLCHSMVQWVLCHTTSADCDVVTSSLQVLAQLSELQAAKKRKTAEKFALSSLFVAAPSAGPQRSVAKGKDKRQCTAASAASNGSADDGAVAGSFSFGFAIKGA